ncbi:MAG: bifunctional diaminohydroxyphosphoribosylaminopyrimidine deaminase/5-amino-6-(5-phosphoribosylamino)uracil reductase RibD, partial [bacterium]
SFGAPHAEVFAIKEAGERARGSTLYVNLEPCCHYGKTPPCTKAIIEAGIKRVVIAMVDPNPIVNGKGIEELRGKGIEVEVGVLEEKARKLNEAYVKFITRGVPFVTLKMAQSLDGKSPRGAGNQNG